MTRVSTAGNYQSALLNLMSAQAQQSEAQNRLATEKVATDMTGFGRGAENLTALKAAAGRIQGFINTGEAVAARLDTQDLALTQIGDGITNARTAISAALASENIEVLMLELQGNFPGHPDRTEHPAPGRLSVQRLQQFDAPGHRQDPGGTGCGPRRRHLHQ